MTKRLRSIIITSALVLALGLSACSGSSDDTPKESESAVESVESESESESVEEDTEIESKESDQESEESETSVETEKKETQNAESEKKEDKKEDAASNKKDDNPKETSGNVASNTESKKETSGNQTVAKPDNKKESESKVNSENKTETKKEQETTKSETSTDVHTHTWVKMTETVHHEAETEQVWVVDQAAWDEPEYGQRAVCNGCGKYMYTQADLDHIHECKSSYYVEQYETGNYIHHKEVGHWETKIVKKAYDSEKEVGRKCTTCGAKERF